MNTAVAVSVRGRHLEVSQGFQDHAAAKFDRIARFGVPLSHIDVEVSRESSSRRGEIAFEVELTCIGSGPVIRAEAAAADKYAALDLAYTRLEERLRRAADRRRDHRTADSHHGTGMAAMSEATPASEPSDAEGDDEVFAQGAVVVREKTHAAGQMDVEQALYEMEFVGHDFFLFRELQTGQAAVVYRRRGYDYGLIRLGEEPAAV